MRHDRTTRLATQHNEGSWSTISAEYFHTVGIMYRRSFKITAEGAKRSLWVYAGLPLLLAGVEAFLVEHQRFFRLALPAGPLAGINPLLDVVKSYQVPDALVRDISDLVEVRHEIMHPATPPFKRGNYPGYIQRLQASQLVEPHIAQSGAEVVSLLASHRLFEWAITRCCDLLDAVAASDSDRSWMFTQLAGNLKDTLHYASRDP